MAYKQIDERFWKDKKIKKLSKDGYILFLYLLTSPHTHFSGISEMSLDYVNIDTPLSEDESKTAYKELCALGLIQYDTEHEIVWIKNMHKYQIKSIKQKKGAETQIKNLPRSVLCKNLAEILNIPYPYPIDTLSIVENTLPIKEEAKAKAKAKAKAYINDDETKNMEHEIEPPRILPTDGNVAGVTNIQEWMNAIAKLNLSQIEIAVIKKLSDIGCIPEDAQKSRIANGNYFGKITGENAQRLIMTERDLRIEKQKNPQEKKRGWAF